jgi:hypothetical protein
LRITLHQLMLTGIGNFLSRYQLDWMHYEQLAQ